MSDAAVPLRMIDQLFHRVFGVPNPNMEVATRWPSRSDGSCGRHDPLRANQGAVAVGRVGADGTPTRIGTKTGLEQRGRKERSADHHQCCDRERTSTHNILRCHDCDEPGNVRGGPDLLFSMTTARAVAPCAGDQSCVTACETNRAGADSADRSDRFLRKDYHLPE